MSVATVRYRELAGRRGAWLAVLGVTVLMLALVGWLFEYYRGEFAR